MSSDRKTLEEKLNQLPASSRANVRDFLEFLFEKNEDDPEFLVNLERACRRIFDKYRPSSYDSWQDLQGDVLLRFKSSMPRYRGDAKSSTVLYTITLNTLIDAKRRDAARGRRSGLDLDELAPEAEPNPSGEDANCHNEARKSSQGAGKKLKQTWAGALKAYRDKYGSVELQKKALEWRGD